MSCVIIALLSQTLNTGLDNLPPSLHTLLSKFGTIKKLRTSIMNDLSYIQSGKSRKVNSTAKVVK